MAGEKLNRVGWSPSATRHRADADPLAGSRSSWSDERLNAIVALGQKVIVLEGVWSMSNIVCEAGGEIQKFLEALRVQGKSERTIYYYQYGLGLFKKYLEGIGVSDLGAVRTQTVGGFKEFVFQKKMANGKQLDFRTQKYVLGFLKRLFAWLFECEKISANPATKLTYPRLPKKISENHLSKDEMKRLLEAVTTETVTGFFDRALFEVFYATGMRQGEVSALKLGDLRLEEGLAYVIDGKGKKDRPVILTETAKKYLTVYLEKVRPRYLCVRKGSDPGSAFVFPNMKGKRILENDLSRKLVRYGNLAGISKPISPHVFRRSLASHLLEAGVDVRYIQALLGHKNTQTTLEYLKVSTQDLARTLSRYHPRNKKTHHEIFRETFNKNFRSQEPVSPAPHPVELFPQNDQGLRALAGSV